MREVLAAVVVVICLGCAGPGPSDRWTDSVEHTETDGSPDGKRDAIRDLVDKSDIIVLGKVTGIRDGTARDVGIGYDVIIETVLCGQGVPEDVLRFRSAGSIGVAKYRMDERVLLFLRRGQNELVQVAPVCYIAEPPAAAGLDLRPVGDYLGFLEGEIRSQKAK